MSPVQPPSIPMVWPCGTGFQPVRIIGPGGPGRTRPGGTISIPSESCGLQLRPKLAGCPATSRGGEWNVFAKTTGNDPAVSPVDSVPHPQRGWGTLAGEQRAGQSAEASPPQPRNHSIAPQTSSTRGAPIKTIQCRPKPSLRPCRTGRKAVSDFFGFFHFADHERVKKGTAERARFI